MNTIKPTRPKNPTFRSIIEVEKLAPFREKNYFHKDDYENVLYDYVGQNTEFNCCLMKTSGKPCKQKHDWGYVVQLKDKSLTLVGNTCIFNELEGGHKALVDIREFRRKREYQERLEQLKIEISHRNNRIIEMESYLESINNSVVRLEEYREILGDTIYTKIRSRARAGDSSIQIEGVKVTKYKDENGKDKTEERRIPHVVGRISNLSAFSSETSHNLIRKIRSCIGFYREFSLDIINEDSSKSYFGESLSKLRDFHKFNDEVQAFSKNVIKFKDNNFLNFIFLDNTTSVQVRLCKLHFKKTANEQITRLDAKHKLNQIEKDLKSQLDVNRLYYG
jgi:hypothetical protein